MGPIGIPELIIILVILLVIFGPKRLPGIGKSLGTGMREFKDSITGKEGEGEGERDATGRELPPAPESSTVSMEKDEPRVHEPRS